MSKNNNRRPQASKNNKRWGKTQDDAREKPIKNKIKKKDKYRPKAVDFDWE